LRIREEGGPLVTNVEENGAAQVLSHVLRQRNTNSSSLRTVPDYALAVANAFAAASSKNAPGAPASIGGRSDVLWRNSGNEIAVHKTFMKGELRCAERYRDMFEVVLVKEYLTSACKAASEVRSCLLLRTELLTQMQLRSFNFARRPEILNTDLVASSSKALDFHLVIWSIVAACGCDGKGMKRSRLSIQRLNGIRVVVSLASFRGASKSGQSSPAESCCKHAL
jgi:hypothetical protein